jgi:hypothetical protein
MYHKKAPLGTNGAFEYRVDEEVIPCLRDGASGRRPP